MRRSNSCPFTMLQNRTVLCQIEADRTGESWIGCDDFLPGEVEGPWRVVEAPGHAFADARRKPNATADQYVSLINLASIAALEGSIGAKVDPLRFRANVYFDGMPAWTELDWLEREI